MKLNRRAHQTHKEHKIEKNEFSFIFFFWFGWRRSNWCMILTIEQSGFWFKWLVIMPLLYRMYIRRNGLLCCTSVRGQCWAYICIHLPGYFIYTYSHHNLFCSEYEYNMRVNSEYTSDNPVCEFFCVCELSISLVISLRVYMAIILFMSRLLIVSPHFSFLFSFWIEFVPRNI